MEHELLLILAINQNSIHNSIKSQLQLRMFSFTSYRKGKHLIKLFHLRYFMFNQRNQLIPNNSNYLTDKRLVRDRSKSPFLTK